MTLIEDVELIAMLQTQNRVQISVEVRQRFKLEPKQFLKAKIRAVESFDSEEFYVRLKPDGRIAIPWEVIWALEIKPGAMLRVMLYAEEQE